MASENIRQDPPELENCTVRVDVERGIMWIMGSPYDLGGDPETSHNCDAMGCGSVSAHVLAIVRYRAIETPDPHAELLALVKSAFERCPGEASGDYLDWSRRMGTAKRRLRAIGRGEGATDGN